MHAASSLFVALAVLASAPAPSRPTTATPTPSARSSRRELVRRPLAITDATANTIPDIHVAAGVPTTLVFPQPLKDAPYLANVGDLFFPAQWTANSVILVPRRDVDGVITTLTVTLVDGTALPFKLVGATTSVDLQVDVSVALEAKAAPDSLGALKLTVAQLRSQLDLCQATAGEAGLRKVADLVLAQNSSAPVAFTVEHRGIHAADKQSRLLVEARHVYRLFGHTYLVTEIENRDPSRVWVLDRPEIRLEGANAAIDVKILSHTMTPSAISPGETARLVVVYPTPSQVSGQRVTFSLYEKNGPRHVILQNLEF